MGALNDRVIVVTGGLGLIGSHFVRAIVDAGGTAIVADIGCKDGLSLLPVAEGRVETCRCDITNADSVVAMREAVLAKYGHIDGLVNNAYPRNARYGRKLEDVTYADFCDNMGMHVGGYFLMMQQLAPALRDAPHGGAIVNMGSVYGSVAPRFSIYDGTAMTMPVEYAAIKSAVLHLTRYFAQYYKAQGIRVNCLSPGGIADGQPESFLDAYNSLGGAKGMLDPADLIATLVHLLGDGARYITGQNIIIDDGWSL